MNDNPAHDAQLARLVTVCATLELDPVVELDRLITRLEVLIDQRENSYAAQQGRQAADMITNEIVNYIKNRQSTAPSESERSDPAS